MKRIIVNTKAECGKVIALFMVAASAILPCATKAGTYTWIGGNSGTWDKTSLNWSDGTTSGVAWQDGNDAVFNNTAEMTITVSGAISAANVTGKSTGNITFNGSGTLAWTGWLGSSGHVYLVCPLTDVNGAGLHLTATDMCISGMPTIPTQVVLISRTRAVHSVRLRLTQEMVRWECCPLRHRTTFSRKEATSRSSWMEATM